MIRGEEGVPASEGAALRCRRQLVIFVDAMEWSVVRRLAEASELPTFGRLIAEGARGTLRTTAEQLPDTVWASTYTGMNPAKLEKYFYVQYDPASLGLRHLTDDAVRATPVWEHLSRARARVGVVDAPKFPLSRSLNGFQVTNWGSHATKTARASNPAPLLDRIESRLGSHPVGDCDATVGTPRALRGLRRRVVEGTRAHGELFRWLMREEDWDVFFASFSASHCIGHHFWRWIEESSRPGRPAASPNGLAGAVEQVYGAIDAEIGSMLALVGDETRVMIVSGHGMGPVRHASWNLPEILDLLGYGAGPAGSAAPNGQPKEARTNPWRTLKATMPSKLQYAIKAMLPQRVQDELLFRWYSGSHRWAGHRAFAIPNNDSVGAIRVSVKGRDKGGLVEPGEEYQRVCRDLAEALEELTDPESGRRVVKRVTRTHEAFAGPHLEGLPDLTVLWDQSFEWEAFHSPRFGTLRLRQRDDRVGSHTDYGFVVAAGSGVAPGREVTDGSIYDIAPTVLAAAGVPIPPEMDGRPLAFG